MNEIFQRNTVLELIEFSSLRYSLDLFSLTQITICVRLAESVKNNACVATHIQTGLEY